MNSANRSEAEGLSDGSISLYETWTSHRMCRLRPKQTLPQRDDSQGQRGHSKMLSDQRQAHTEYIPLTISGSFNATPYINRPPSEPRIHSGLSLGIFIRLNLLIFSERHKSKGVSFCLHLSLKSPNDTNGNVISTISLA